MQVSQFQQNYPELAGLLSDYSFDDLDDLHPVKFAVVDDHPRTLHYFSRLLDQTPHKKIASAHEGDLGTVRGFESYLSELIGYIVTEWWLCSNPTVLDTKGAVNEPEFACEDFDVEVARLRQSREEDRVRVHLEQELNDSYLVVAEKTPEYDDFAGDADSWDENEEQVEQILEEIGEVDDADLPITGETDAFRVRVHQSEGGYIETANQGVIDPDSSGKIVRTVSQKANKVRGNRPFIVFLDMDLKSVDFLEEVERELIGQPYQGASETSPVVENADPKWDSYLEAAGAKYENSSPSAVRPGDEGLFASDNVSQIAGVMVRFYHNEVGFVPNPFTEDVDAKAIYDHLGWGRETRTLGPSKI